MKRIRTGRTGALVSSTGGEQGFWPSYADMMSAVALILFFLMLLSYIQNLVTGNDLQNTQEVLETTRVTLSDTESRLVSTTKQVEEAESELRSVTGDLDAAKLTLEEQEKAIAAYKEAISGYAEKITSQEETIAVQQSLIDEQKDYLASANSEILSLRSQMQTIAVLRLSILEQIRENLSQVMGDDTKVSIGDNGNIILSDSVLFDTGSSEIKAGSKTVLNELIQVFSQFLSDSENTKYVDSIVISGHTDSTGSEASNRVLSTDRANSVLNYLLTGKNGALNKYSSYFCAAGYGATRPVVTNDTEEGRAQNRRIEISIILKDDTVLEIVNDYLKIDVPESVTNTTENSTQSKQASDTKRS